MNESNRINCLSKVIFLMGPTASGKTDLAIKLSNILPVELISVDSGLIYQGMNIGTAKPNSDSLKKTPHRLIDILDPSQSYSAANFRRDALIEINNIIKKGYIPMLVGGTMFYFKFLLEGSPILPVANFEIREKIKRKAIVLGWKTLHYQLSKIDPIAAARIHPNDSYRISRALEVFFISNKTLTELTQNSNSNIPYQIHQFAISTLNREILYKKIEQRFYKMLSLGFEKEVQILFSRGDLNKNMPSIRRTGYYQMWLYLEGKISYEEMIYQSIKSTKKLAKHQITWLQNWKWFINWIDSDDPQQALQEITKSILKIKNNNMKY